MQNRRRQNRLAKKAMLLILVYLIIVGFSIAYSVFAFLTIKKVVLVSEELEIYILLVTYFVLTSNSCLNPIIYIRKDPEFKAAWKRFLIRMKCKTRTSPLVNANKKSRDTATSSVWFKQDSEKEKKTEQWKQNTDLKIHFIFIPIFKC